mgnify:CR=1 FL=1
MNTSSAVAAITNNAAPHTAALRGCAAAAKPSAVRSIASPATRFQTLVDTAGAASSVAPASTSRAPNPLTSPSCPSLSSARAMRFGASSFARGLESACFANDFQDARQIFSLAFFNGVKENGLDGRDGNADPFLKLPSGEQQKLLDEVTAKIKTREAELAAARPGDYAANFREILTARMQSAVARGTPWSEQPDLDVIAVLDTPSWAVLVNLIA